MARAASAVTGKHLACCSAPLTGSDHGVQQQVVVHRRRPRHQAGQLSATPLWQQLVDELRAQTLNGKIPPDRKLPTEASLAESLGVGRSTSARAIAHLREEGLVVFAPGRGAFSAPATSSRRPSATVFVNSVGLLPTAAVRTPGFCPGIAFGQAVVLLPSP